MACFNPRNQIEELISASNQTSTWSIKNMRSWLIIILMLGYESNRFQEGLITYLKISKISTYSNCSKKRVQMPGGGETAGAEITYGYDMENADSMSCHLDRRHKHLPKSIQVIPLKLTSVIQG